MKTREDILNDILSLRDNIILLQLGTGVGKTRIAIEKLNQRCPNNSNVLIVAPTYTIIDGWPAEFEKWGFKDLLNSRNIVFSTYDSLEKRLSTEWQMIIFDEAHHLSERCLGILRELKADNILFLTATIGYSTFWGIKTIYPQLKSYRVSLKEAINEGILSDPTVVLIPLKLDTTKSNQIYTIEPAGYTSVDPIPHIMTASMYWKLKRADNKRKYTLKGNAWEYNELLTSFIELYRKRDSTKNKFLQLSGIRLKWLSRQKDKVIKSILKQLDNERTLTFCSDVEHTEVFGPYSIHSKKEDPLDILRKFNTGEINHIQACKMLNEGVNLVNCRIGIFANISSSDIMVTQRNGRILRHQSPIIIIPYYVKTREEEIISNLIQLYNKDSIRVINNPNKLKTELKDLL